MQSLDFTFNRLCMKLCKTGSIDVVKDCLSCFAIIDLPSYYYYYYKKKRFRWRNVKMTARTPYNTNTVTKRESDAK